MLASLFFRKKKRKAELGSRWIGGESHVWNFSAGPPGAAFACGPAFPMRPRPTKAGSINSILRGHLPMISDGVTKLPLLSPSASALPPHSPTSQSSPRSTPRPKPSNHAAAPRPHPTPPLLLPPKAPTPLRGDDPLASAAATSSGGIHGELSRNPDPEPRKPDPRRGRVGREAARSTGSRTAA